MDNLLNRPEHEYTFTTDVFGTDRYGRPIKVQGKEHYKRLMAKGGFVPIEEAQAIAAESKKRNQSPGYKPSPELLSFLRQMKQSADSKGNVRLSGRAIKKMKEFGVSFDSCLPDHLKDNPLEGGISNA